MHQNAFVQLCNPLTNPSRRSKCKSPGNWPIMRSIFVLYGDKFPGHILTKQPAFPGGRLTGVIKMSLVHSRQFEWVGKGDSFPVENSEHSSFAASRT